MERSLELQKVVDSLAETMEYETIEILELGAKHGYRCRCSICLRYWVLIGPEEVSDTEWSFGPFTEEEFIAAGGVIPEHGDYYDDYDDEEWEEE